MTDKCELEIIMEREKKPYPDDFDAFQEGEIRLFEEGY